MSLTVSLLVTTIITVVALHLLDWLSWGTPWMHRNVFPKVPKEIWRLPAEEPARTQAGRLAMLLGALVTTFVGIVAVPLVWMLGPQFAGARIVIPAILVWAAFLLPGALYNAIYYRLPKAITQLQIWSGLARSVLIFVLISWLLTTFQVW